MRDKGLTCLHKPNTRFQQTVFADCRSLWVGHHHEELLAMVASASTAITEQKCPARPRPSTARV